MSKVAVFLIIFGLAPFVPLEAEPGPPSISFPTGDTAWSIDITPHDQSASVNPASGKQVVPTRIEVVRTGEISHYHFTWSNEKTTDDWLNAKYAIYTNPITGTTLCSPLVGDVTVTVKYPTYDQSLFSWVSSSELVGPTTYQGVSCVQVRKLIPQAAHAPGTPEPPPSYMQAWIDEKSHRPVAMDDGSARYAYTFLKAPLPVAVMPKEYQDYLVRYENALKPPQAWGNVR